VLLLWLLPTPTIVIAERAADLIRGNTPLAPPSWCIRAAGAS
jgi:hypothetical protein